VHEPSSMKNGKCTRALRVGRISSTGHEAVASPTFAGKN
jgi:hypothetical protein